jgi:hypothetical protein
MKDYEIKFTLEDQEKLVRLFALQQGWCREWLLSQQEAMESLYDRKVDLLDAAIHCIGYKTYPVDDQSCLRHDFIEAFFARFPQIEILQRPDLTFVARALEPRMVEKYTYEDAWKHHIQVLVLMEPSKRIEYLFSYVPQSLREELAKRQEQRRQRMNELRQQAT